MALALRSPFDLEAPSLPAEFLAQRGQKGRLSVNPRNRGYPIVVATVLDALESAEGSYAKAARALGLTTSQLLRFLRSDPHIWREVAQTERRR
jgi:transcriptional regulator with GAF, ATPase, and Fis domain